MEKMMYERFLIWINNWSSEKLNDLYDWDSDCWHNDNVTCEDCE